LNKFQLQHQPLNDILLQMEQSQPMQSATPTKYRRVSSLLYSFRRVVITPGCEVSTTSDIFSPYMQYRAEIEYIVAPLCRGITPIPRKDTYVLPAGFGGSLVWVMRLFQSHVILVLRLLAVCYPSGTLQES
jgi:hypothetical protein